MTLRRERLVRVDVGPVRLEGYLDVPDGARGLVLFAHGSGSGRHSVRNQYVAGQLSEGGVAFLLFDLLTPAEEIREDLRFDIPLLSERVIGALDWAAAEPETADLPLGLFGASTGAAAALIAAAARPHLVKAVVSRGGRPDLAGHALAHVQAPTLLIVGGADLPVIGLNEMAQRQMRCDSRLEIVPGATHLFPEPGALPRVAHLARDWFLRHLS